jgi:CheY-like chemotaxis protein
MNLQPILIAEDDPRDEELTLATLDENHLANQVFVVRDGAEILDYLYGRGEFDGRVGGNPVAILLDLYMPKVSGLEVLNIIKADENLRTIPVLMMASSAEAPELTECLRKGAESHLLKPLDFGEFIRAAKALGVYWAAVSKPAPEMEGNSKKTDVKDVVQGKDR